MSNTIIQQVLMVYDKSSKAVNIFINMVVQEKGLPFAVKIPNKETIQAIKELERGETEKVTLAELEEEAKQCLR